MPLTKAVNFEQYARPTFLTYILISRYAQATNKAMPFHSARGIVALFMTYYFCCMQGDYFPFFLIESNISTVVVKLKLKNVKRCSLAIPLKNGFTSKWSKWTSFDLLLATLHTIAVQYIAVYLTSVEMRQLCCVFLEPIRTHIVPNLCDKSFLARVIARYKSLFACDRKTSTKCATKVSL